MKKIKLLLFIIVLGFVGCTNIPKEAPALSSELGKRIKDTQETNEILIRSYFTLRKSLMEEYLYKDYLPYVANDFFAGSDMENIWLKVVSSGNKDERMEYILYLAPKLQKMINEKRTELITPLDDLENALLQRMKEEYDSMYLINDSLTNYLEASYKSELKKQSLLERAGINQSKIADVIRKVDDASGDFVGSSKLLPEKIESFKEKIENIKKGVK